MKDLTVAFVIDSKKTYKLCLEEDLFGASKIPSYKTLKNKVIVQNEENAEDKSFIMTQKAFWKKFKKRGSVNIIIATKK